MYHMNYLKRVLTQLNANDVFYSFLCFLPLEIYNFFLMLIKIILLSGKGYVHYIMYHFQYNIVILC